jgi:hypothetical protein
MAVKMSMVAFSVAMPCTHVTGYYRPEDGGSMFLRKLVSTYKSTRLQNLETTKSISKETEMT